MASLILPRPARPSRLCRYSPKRTTRALATVRVWKKRLEHQAHSRSHIRGGCGLPVTTDHDDSAPVTPHNAPFPTYKPARGPLTPALRLNVETPPWTKTP